MSDPLFGQPEEHPIGTSPRMRDQPSLTTSTGRSWLLLGGLLSLIALVVLIPMLSLPPMGVAGFGVVAVVLLYAVMLIAQLFLKPGRVRLAVLAAGMTAIALISLVCAGVVAAAEIGAA
ncbi:MAG: hypothetical protein JWR53_1316 [Glaciihabitans sp.]|nr:hypothetical protein [Glaciihabitans sp.]MCU1534835.1 hypothetical protein [Glaciihabitans sp.]MDQ1555414.1 hypothetical protein [Actinomycetota bacterium]